MYIKRLDNTTNEYHELQAIYPNSSLPVDGTIVILGHSFVFNSPRPEYDPQTEKVVEIEPLLLDSKYYRAYEVALLSQEELDRVILAEVAEVERAIDGLIQDEIAEYNGLNGTKYRDVDSLPKYERNVDYTHYAFIVSCLDWVELVWETSRQLQIDIASGAVDKPASVGDFVALLPERV